MKVQSGRWLREQPDIFRQLCLFFVLVLFIVGLTTSRLRVADARSTPQYKVVRVNISVGPNGEPMDMSNPRSKVLTIQTALDDYTKQGWDFASVVNVPTNTSGEGTYLIFKKGN